MTIRLETKSILRPQLLKYLQEYPGRFFYLDKIYQLHSRASGLASRQFFLKLLAKMNVDYDIEADELPRLPAVGPLVVVANHPFGGLEGISGWNS